MASGTDDTFELRVLYGPQAGSRLSLVAGHEYVLGTSAECTVMLSGPRVAEEHAEITFDGDQFLIRPLDGVVCDAQGNQQSDVSPLTLGMPMELGGIWISVDHVDTPWPDTESVLPIANRASTNTEESSAETDAARSSSITSATDSVQPPDWTKSRKFPIGKVIATIGLVAISGSVLAMWLGNEPHAEADSVSTENKHPAHNPLTVPASIGRAIHNHGLGNALNAERNEKGNWVVSGYVPTTAQKQKVLDELSLIVPHPIANIFVEEELVNGVNSLLKENTIAGKQLLHVDSMGGGNLRLLGAAASEELVAAALKEIKAKFDAVRTVESVVALPDKLRTLLKEKISAAGLTDRLEIIKERPEFVLKGDLTNEEITRWENLFIEFCRANGNILTIRASVGGDIHTVALDVQSIVSGPIPYIVTKQGERINTGGTINGRTIVAIRDGNVTFDGNEQLRGVR